MKSYIVTLIYKKKNRLNLQKQKRNTGIKTMQIDMKQSVMSNKGE